VGVGGGFLTTPILIFFGIRRPVARSHLATTQITGASVSGVLAHSPAVAESNYRMGAWC
jgi:uncharacterized membrane protein YfcA